MNMSEFIPRSQAWMRNNRNFPHLLRLLDMCYWQCGRRLIAENAATCAGPSMPSPGELMQDCMRRLFAENEGG